MDLLDRTDALGFEGIELRREGWEEYETELPDVRRWAGDPDATVTYATFSELLCSERGGGREMLLHDIDTAAELGSPFLRVFLGRTPDEIVHAVETLDALADRILYTHLLDPTAPDGALGGGTMPMDDVLDALDALPQDVYYCFEFRGGDDPEEAIGKSAAYLESRAG